MISVYTGLCLEISLYILLTWNKAEEEKFEDIKGVIRSCKSKKDDRQYNDQKKKDRQYNGQKKDRQYNGQKKKGRQYNDQKKDRQYNDQKKKDKQWSTIQNTTQKKVLATRTPLETRVKSGSPEG